MKSENEAMPIYKAVIIDIDAKLSDNSIENKYIKIVRSKRMTPTIKKLYEI